jgi:esterase/lipase superfamily enzyme
MTKARLTKSGVSDAVLRVMVEVVDDARTLRITTLFNRTREHVGRSVSEKRLNAALDLLIADNIVIVRGKTVTRKRSTVHPLGIRKYLNPAVSRGVGGPPRVRHGGFADPASRRITKSAGGFLDIFSRRRGAAKKVTSRKRGGVGGPRAVPRPTPKPKPRVFKELGEKYKVPVYYATNRMRDENGKYLNDGKVAKKLDRGRLNVTFPKRRDTGEFQDPGDWIWRTLRPDKRVDVVDIERLTKSKFHRAMKSDLKEYGQSMFVFVHGAMTSFDTAVARTAQILLDTGFPGCAVAFSWTSQANPRHYKGDFERLRDSASSLGDLLLELRASHPAATIHVISHSMGAHAAAEAIALHGAALGVSEILLSAPDISDIDYGRLAPLMVASTRRVTVYANPKDNALKLANEQAGYDRVGQDVTLAIHDDVEAIDTSAVGDGTIWQHANMFRKPIMADVRGIMDGSQQVRPPLQGVTNAGVVTHYEFRKP